MANPLEAYHLDELRRRVDGWRVLLVGNRDAAVVSDRLARELGLRCTVEDAAGKPRRRASLIERIGRRSYDAALVAHEFTRHADTDAIAAACRRVGIPYIAVGRGRFSEITLAMRAVLLPGACAKL